MNKPNSKGSLYGAYKLSNIGLEKEVTHSDNLIQLAIGCDDDDTFYDPDNEGRLKVYVETNESMVEFDLEEFLTQVKTLCPHLFNPIHE